MSMKQLFVSDMDGTLLNTNAELSAYTYEKLSVLLQKGLPLTLATARTYYGVCPILQELPFSIPLILQNGALLYDYPNRRILHAEEIPPHVFTAVCAAMAENDVEGFVYCAEDGVLRCCYHALKTESMRQFYQERRDRYEKPFYQVDSLRELAEAHPVYVTMNAPQKVLQPIVDTLRAPGGMTLSFYQDVYREGIWYLEISAETASKQHGIAWLRQQYGFDYVTGFGDNANDLPLFAGCDRKIAVENAVDCLKSAADSVIGKNTDDAVVRALEALWNGN